MDPTVFKPWLDLLVSYGVPLIITAGFLWLVWKYLPAWIESSIKAQTQVPLELAKLNNTLTTGFGDFRAVMDDMHAIKEAFRHGAAAGEAVVAKKPETEVAIELRKMREAVETDRRHSPT